MLDFSPSLIYNIVMKKITLPILFFSLLLGGCTLPTVPALNPPASSITPTVSIPSPAPTIDQTSQIKTDIQQALIAKHGASAKDLTITVSKIEGMFSSGGAGGQGGGGMWFAVKPNDHWLLVWDGNGTINCSDLSSYPDFPATLISECYNPTTKKSVTR